MKLDICAFIKRWIFWGLTRPGQLSAPLPSRHGFMFLTSSEIQLGMYVVTKLPFQKVQSWFHAWYFQEAQDFDTVLTTEFSFPLLVNSLWGRCESIVKCSIVSVRTVILNLHRHGFQFRKSVQGHPLGWFLLLFKMECLSLPPAHLSQCQPAAACFKVWGERKRHKSKEKGNNKQTKNVRVGGYVSCVYAWQWHVEKQK